MKLFHRRLTTIFLACVLILFYNVSCKREAQEAPFIEKETEQFSTKDLTSIRATTFPHN
jgi:hypothetical protein